MSFFSLLPALILGASGAFLSQGPAPANSPFEGAGNSDAGTVVPVVVSPTDVNTLFVGGCNGGIWRTQNSGATWTPLTDHQASPSIASIGFDPTDVTSNTLIAGTGATSNGRVGPITGGPPVGVYYTTDGGNTWTTPAGNTALTRSVMGVVARGTTLLAATFEQNAFNMSGAPFGLYRSVNGGTSFSKVALPGQAVTSPVTSLVGDFNPALNPTLLWAAATDPTNKSNTALYASTDTGSTWTSIFNAAQSNGLIQNATQTVLKVATGPSNTLAVAVINTNDNRPNARISGVFWSNDGGATWTQIFNQATAAVDFNPDGDGVNCSTLAIDPVNPNIVYVSGTFVDDAANGFPSPVYSFDRTMPINTAVSLVAGAGSTYTHADSRQFAFRGTNALLLSTDGGFNIKSPPATGSWQSLNGNLSLFQGYALGYDANYNLLIIAAQDTGISIQTAPNALLYQSLMITGDGANAQVNDKTSAVTSYYYSSAQNLNQLNRITNSGAQTLQFLNLTGGNPQPQFLSEIVLNHINPSKIVVGGSTDGTNSFAVSLFQDDFVSSNLALTPVGGPLPGPNTNVGPMDYGTTDAPDALLVGTSAGLFFSRNIALTPLANIAAYPGVAPLSLVFDPRSADRYFIIDNLGSFVSTVNAGNAFFDLTPELPPNLQGANSHRFAVEFLSNNGVNALFVGGFSNNPNQSPIAVADSDAAGVVSNFRLFGQGLPNILVEQISYNSKSDTLLANTFGRGIYIMYDVTSNFSNANVLQFGLANNDSTPDTPFLSNGDLASRPLVKYGTGTLTLSGVATYTGTTTINRGALVLTGGGGLNSSTSLNINAGIFDIAAALNPVTIQDLSGASGSSINLGPNTLTFGTPLATTFSGALSVPGVLVKQNSGIFTLNGVSPFTGAFNVNGGTLQMNAPGSLAPTSLTTIASGATLRGTGTLGNVILNGTVSPGLSIGTLTVNNFTFNSGSSYSVEFNNTTSDLINATAQVTLNAGSTLTTIPLNVTQPQVSSYLVINAAGGVVLNGPFTLINAYPRFQFSVQYNPNDVRLILDRVLPFSASGNGSGAARCFNQIVNNPDLINLVNILNAQTLSQWQHSFDQMQPSGLNNIAYAEENVAEKIRQVYSSHLFEILTPQVGSLWLAPFLEQVDQEGREGYKEQFSGFTLAGDYKLPRHWWLTTGFSFASSHLKIPQGGAAGEFKTYAGSLGALYKSSSFSCDTLFSYLYNSSRAHRKMRFSAAVPTFSGLEVLKASHHAGSNQLLGHWGGRYDFIFGSTRPRRNHHKIYPFVNLDYIYAVQRAYREKGAHSLDLTVRRQSTDLLRPEGGIGWSYKKCLAKASLLLDLSASYVREERLLGKKTKSSFKKSSCEFTSQPLFPKNNLVCPSARLGLTLPGSSLSIVLGYHGEYGSHFVLNSGNAELKVAF